MALSTEEIPVTSPKTRVVRSVVMRVLAKRMEPAHVQASVGDRVILELIGEEEDHRVVIPDFDVQLHLEPGERRTIELTMIRPGYFPFGCISCCARYRCQTKQALLVDVKEPLSKYGE